MSKHCSTIQIYRIFFQLSFGIHHISFHFNLKEKYQPQTTTAKEAQFRYGEMSRAKWTQSDETQLPGRHRPKGRCQFNYLPSCYLQSPTHQSNPSYRSSSFWTSMQDRYHGIRGHLSAAEATGQTNYFQNKNIGMRRAKSN